MPPPPAMRAVAQSGAARNAWDQPSPPQSAVNRSNGQRRRPHGAHLLTRHLHFAERFPVRLDVLVQIHQAWCEQQHVGHAVDHCQRPARVPSSWRRGSAPTAAQGALPGTCCRARKTHARLNAGLCNPGKAAVAAPQFQAAGGCQRQRQAASGRPGSNASAATQPEGAARPASTAARARTRRAASALLCRLQCSAFDLDGPAVCCGWEAV